MKLAPKIIVATLLLCALILVGWWQDKKETQKIDADEKAAQVVSLDSSDLQKVILTINGTKMEFQKREKNDKGQFNDEFALLDKEFSLVTDWMMVKPVRSLVDYATWNNLINNVEGIKSTKTIAEDSSRASDYNLANAPFVIEMFKIAKTEKPDEVLKIGDENPGKTGYYALSTSSPKIYLVDNRLQFALNKKANEWRDTRLMGFKDLSKVKELSVFKQGKNLFTAKRSNDKGSWEITEPEKYTASTTAVEGILNQLDSARVKEILSEDIGEVQSKLGLNQPHLEAKIVVEEDGQDVTKVVKMSLKSGKPESAVFYRSGIPTVSLVSDSVMKNLDKKPEELINKRPFEMASDKITSFQITSESKETYEFSKKGEGWTSNKKDAKPYTGFFKITSLEGSAFLGKTLPKSLTNIGASYLHIQLKNDKEQEGLVIYKNTHKKEEQTYYVGRSEPKGFYYEFTSADVEGIANSIEEMLDKQESHPLDVTKPHDGD